MIVAVLREAAVLVRRAGLLAEGQPNRPGVEEGEGRSLAEDVQPDDVPVEGDRARHVGHSEYDVGDPHAADAIAARRA